MARYSVSYRFPVSAAQIYALITQIMEECQLQVEFQGNDYMMAKEKPGELAFPKLVNVDIMVNLTYATPEQVPVDLVVRNEELALKNDNHAWKKFEQVKQLIAEKYPADLL